MTVASSSNGENTNGLNISVPDEIFANNTFDITVTIKGSPVEGATVLVNGNSTGNTSADGTIQYTATNVGTISLTAEMNGYQNVNKNVNVLPPNEDMSLSFSPNMVYIGDNFTIEALKRIGGDPIVGANISVDGQPIGATGSDGNITYKTDKNGTITVSATKDGFNNNSVSVMVNDLAPIFIVSNLTANPTEVNAGQNVTISANIVNTGRASGNYSAVLYVNNTTVDSKDVYVDVGGNSTLTFSHSEIIPGNYTVELGGQTATYKVKEKSSYTVYPL